MQVKPNSPKPQNRANLDQRAAEFCDLRPSPSLLLAFVSVFAVAPGPIRPAGRELALATRD